MYVAWREDGLKERCARRAAELGKTLQEVLVAAQMGHDTLDRVPPNGRRTDTLDKLARELDWSLAQVMGIELYIRLTGEYLGKALAMAQRLLRPYLREGAEVQQIHDEAAAILNLIIARIIEGHEVTDDYLAGIERTLSSLPRQPPEK